MSEDCYPRESSTRVDEQVKAAVMQALKTYPGGGECRAPGDMPYRYYLVANARRAN